MKETRDLSEYESLKPWLLNVIRQEVERLNKLSVSPPLELVNQGGGPSIRMIDYTCYGKITAVGTTTNGITPYAWKEQQANGDGTFSDLPGGRQGSVANSQQGTVTQNPLYETNKSATVAVGTVVQARLGVAGEWYFTAGGGGSGTTTFNPIVGFRCLNGQTQYEQITVTGPFTITNSP